MTEATEARVDSRPLGRVVAALGPALPVLVVVGICTALVASQGGYFAPSWGWAAVLFAGAIAAWLFGGANSDAGRFDLVWLAAIGAFVGFVALSHFWSADPSQTVVESERSILLLLGATAFVVLLRRGHLAVVAVSVHIAITGIAVYSLLTRLVPDHFGGTFSSERYRLLEPVGYWNGLGLLAAMGLVLAAGTCSEPGARRFAVAIGGCAFVVLPLTMYFTFARASWGAVALGTAILIILSQHRLRLLATITVLAVPGAVAVLLASRSAALTHRGTDLAAAASAGHRLAPIVAALALVGGLLALGVHWLAARIQLARRVRLAVSAVLVVAVVAVFVAGVARAGGPVDVVKRAYDAFVVPPYVETDADLNDRLFKFSGSGRADLWRFSLTVARQHPVIGAGAGTFERLWQESPKNSFRVRDGHSLYFETVAEFGAIGLGLVVALIAIPLVVGLRSRRNAYVPAVLATYCAFFAHAAIDWDWELAGVTLLALLLGASMLTESRTSKPKRLAATPRRVAWVAVVALAALSVVGYVGNESLARARSAAAAGDFAQAVAHADVANTWMPWSPDPLVARGEAEISLGRLEDARATLERAIGRDDKTWIAWLDLAIASSGDAQETALARARALYPRSREISETADSFAGR